MSGEKCPSDEQLRDFSFGKAAAQVIDEIAEHLEACADCSERIERIESCGDDLLRRLHGQDQRIYDDDDWKLEERLRTLDLVKPPHVARDQVVVRDSDETHCESARGSTFRVRCPHCHVLVEASDQESLSDLTCDACGSAFSLVENDRQTRTAPIRRSIAQFDLVERLGFGAFGEVWKARDRQLDRTVAVKIPRKGQLDKDEAEKFLREARAAAQLKHPSIVGIHEVGREGDTLYIVSDLVRGLTLADWLTGQRPSQRDAAKLCSTIALALHHAHEAGVVHRDLKPSNIMLDDDNQPHVMDFGLAKRDTGEVTMTIEGQILPIENKRYRRSRIG